MDNRTINNGDKKMRFQNEIPDITLDPPGNRIDKELLQFLNNSGRSSGSKPMILLFPPGLSPVVTKAIKYHAKMFNLTVLYLRHGNELIVGVCRKHFIKEELRDEVAYEEEDTEPYKAEYVEVKVNANVEHHIEKKTRKLMNLPTYGLKLDDQLKPLKKKVKEFAEIGMVRKSGGFLGLPPPDRELCILPEFVVHHTPSTINLTSEFQYLDQAQVVEPSVLPIEPENPYSMDTGENVEVHIAVEEMMPLPTEFSYPVEVQGCVFYPPEMPQNVPDTTSIEVAASLKKKRRKGKKKKSQKGSTDSVQLPVYNVQPIITTESCYYTQPYSYDSEQRNNPTVTIGATGEGQVILGDAHSMKDTSVTEREADEMEPITQAKKKKTITKNAQSKQGTDYITRAEEYVEMIKSDHFMEETSTMEMRSGERKQIGLAGENQSIKANAHTKWKIPITVMECGKPKSITSADENVIIIEDPRSFHRTLTTNNADDELKGELQSAAVGYQANMEDVHHTKEEISITEIEVDNPEKIVPTEQIEIITKDVHHAKEEISITEIEVDNTEKVVSTEQIEMVTEDVHHVMEEISITEIEVDDPEKVVPTEQIEIITEDVHHAKEEMSITEIEVDDPEKVVPTEQIEIITEDVHHAKEEMSITEIEVDDPKKVVPTEQIEIITEDVHHAKEEMSITEIEVDDPEKVVPTEQIEIITEDVHHAKEEMSITEIKVDNPKKVVPTEQSEIITEDVHHAMEEISITEIEVDNPEKVVPTEQIEIITEDVHLLPETLTADMKAETSVSVEQTYAMETFMEDARLEQMTLIAAPNVEALREAEAETLGGILREYFSFNLGDEIIVECDLDPGSAEFQDYSTFLERKDDDVFLQSIIRLMESVASTDDCEVNYCSNEDAEDLPRNVTLALNTLTNKSPYIQQLKRYVGDEFTLVFPKENFLPYRSPLFQMEHIVELYDFPTSFNTAAILKRFKKKPRYIKWCDDNHALLVTKSPESANLVLGSQYNDIKLRPMSQASPIATVVACRSILVTKEKSYTSPTYEGIAIEDSATRLEEDSEITTTAYPVIFEDPGAGDESIASTNFDAERENISHTEQGQGDVWQGEQ